MDLKSLQSILTSDPNIRLALLFGSRATGSAADDSDIDLAIVAEPALSAEEKLNLIEAIANRTGLAVDLVDLQTAGEPLLGQILSKGRRLLVRDESLLVELIRQHLYDAEDFLPYRRRILEQRRQAWIAK